MTFKQEKENNGLNFSRREPEKHIPFDYKYTEVGVIPVEWQAMNIQELFEVTAGGDFDPNRSGDVQSDRYPYPIYANGLSLQGLYGFCDCAENQPGSITVSARGTLGKAFYRDTPFAAIGRLLVLKPKVGMDARFFSDYINYGVRFAVENTGVPQLTAPQVATYSLPVPPEPEQRAIAEALTDLDRLLAALEALIAKKRAIKLAALQRLLTGKTRMPGFSGQWTKVNLTYDSILKARIGWQGLTTAEHLKSGDYYLVTGTDFSGGRINWSGCFFVDYDRFMQDANIQLAPGDVLLTKDGTIGKVGLVDSLPLPATLNSGIFVIRPRKNAYIPMYLYYVLTSRIFENFLGRLQAGSTISHLYQKDFVDFTFEAPQLNEQRAITVFLSDMDAEIDALEIRRDKTRAIKQAMMQQLLTGRVRLIAAEGTEHG